MITVDYNDPFYGSAKGKEVIICQNSGDLLTVERPMQESVSSRTGQLAFV
jgi:hypothetical protein